MLIWSIMVVKFIAKFQLTMGTIVERGVDMFTSTVFRVSKTSSIVDCNIVEGWFICSRPSTFL